MRVLGSSGTNALCCCCFCHFSSAKCAWLNEPFSSPESVLNTCPPDLESELANVFPLCFLFSVATHCAEGAATLVSPAKFEERDANGQQLPLRTKIPGYYMLFRIQISHFPLKPSFRANYNCSNSLFTPACSFICLYPHISLIFLTHRVECWVRMLIIRAV